MQQTQSNASSTGQATDRKLFSADCLAFFEKVVRLFDAGENSFGIPLLLVAEVKATGWFGSYKDWDCLTPEGREAIVELLASRKMSEKEYRQEQKRLEVKIKKAKSWLKEPCTLKEKIERKSAVKQAENNLHNHKLNYFELVDSSPENQEPIAVFAEIGSD